jgi:hypothetical protein
MSGTTLKSVCVLKRIAYIEKKDLVVKEPKFIMAGLFVYR